MSDAYDSADSYARAYEGRDKEIAAKTNKYRKKAALEASKPSGPNWSEANQMGAAKGAASAAASGGGAADIASAGLIASGNPYAMAAGVGLGMMSASAKRKREAANKREENRYNAETDRRNSTMRALQAAQSAASAFS